MDDRLMPAGGEARLRRPTIRVALVFALAIGIVGLGILGPHNPNAPNPTATDGSTPAPTLADQPTPAAASPSFGGNGLLQMEPNPADVRQSWLPTQISSSSMALLGSRLFYIVATDRIESIDIGGQTTRTLVTVPQCQTINQLAAAGETLAYVVTTPVATTGGVFGCAGPSEVAWTLNLLDLRTGKVRHVESGTRTAETIDIAEFPVHVAISDSAYAFERPANTAIDAWGAMVEVHALDGHLLWKSPISPHVTQLVFRGGTLAALTQSVPPYEDEHILWLASNDDPQLREVATPAASASLSSDGSYVIFDLPIGTNQEFLSVALQVGRPDSGAAFITHSGSIAAQPLHPVVASSSHGLVVAWLLTTPAGGVFPAFRFQSDRAAVEIPTVQEPIWIGLEDTTLVWVTQSGDGWSTGVFATDLWQIESR
jgi:hypothetical protein